MTRDLFASGSREAILSMKLEAGGADWVPTAHGRFLAEVLAQHDLVGGRDVLELGAGVGNHTIVMLRRGARHIVATEVTEDLLESTISNVRRNCARSEGAFERVEFRVADWLHTRGRFEVVVTNPPFAKSGKQNRRYFIDALILNAHKRLRGAGSRVVFVQSSMADIAKTLRRLDENGFDAQILATTTGPFRDYYFEDATFMREIESVPGAYELVDGMHHETLYVVQATLRPYTPPPGAHVVRTD